MKCTLLLSSSSLDNDTRLCESRDTLDFLKLSNAAGSLCKLSIICASDVGLLYLESLETRFVAAILACSSTIEDPLFVVSVGHEAASDTTRLSSALFVV